jgi:sugar phosphate isomerase/epimerase
VDSPHVHIPFDKIDQYASFLEEKKLNLEIYFSANTLDSTDSIRIAKRVADLEYGPSLSIHAPFMDLSPAAVDPKIRDVTQFRFNQVMDIANDIQPKTIVFHSGYEKWKYELNIDIWLEKSLITWNEMLERAVKIDARLAIENIFEDAPDNLSLLAEKIDSDYFGLCFDTGHFNLFSHVSLNDWIDQTGRYIVELHIHDNDGTKDAHESPGKGTFDFPLLFDLMKDRNDVLCTVEAHNPGGVLEGISFVNNC